MNNERIMIAFVLVVIFFIAMVSLPSTSKRNQAHDASTGCEENIPNTHKCGITAVPKEAK